MTPRPTKEDLTASAKRNVTLEQIKQEYVLAVLEENGWNITQAAKQLDIERVTLNRMIKRYKLKRPKE